MLISDTATTTPIPTDPKAFIIGIAGALIKDTSAVTTAEFVRSFRAIARDSRGRALTRKLESLAVKYRPGMTHDTAWAPAPNLPALQQEHRRA
jgi:hypothetical protein